VDALRIRQDQVLKTELSPGVPPVRERTVTYSFASKIGELVSVVTPDTVSTSGVVSGVVSWTIPGTKTKVESDELIPANFSLAQNYPNPFNPVTVINYELDKTAEVELAIFNLLGQKIRVLVHETKAKGSHSVQWNGKDDAGNRVSTGFYVYRLKTAKASISKKMILLE
ncbi:MAG: FlgD immunoglobulin-like domain containing protein, partial [Nitrosomonadaceae bacterium]